MSRANPAGTAATKVGGDRAAARYDAFISYSHVADNLLAPALRNALQRFATPWRVFQWTNPTRLLRIFQDQASLSANPRLWPSIEDALAAADWLVLFASPASAQSAWVGKEIDFWRAHKSMDRLLIVQTDGDIAWNAGNEDFDWSCTTALPPRLRGAFKDEPRWIDARWARMSTRATLKDPRFRELVAELAAPLRGVPKDELIGEDIRQVRRLEILRNAALALLSLLLAGATLLAAVAVRQRHLAEERLATAQRSESKALAVRAVTELDSEGPAAAVRIALAGLPKDIASGDRPFVAEAEAALLNGLRQLRELRHFGGGQASALEAAAASPDGRQLAIGFQDGSVRLLDVATGKLLHLLRAANASGSTTVSKDGSISTSMRYGSVVLLAFSADGSSLITVDASATARVWDLATGRPRAVLRGIDDVKLVFSAVTAAVSPDGRFVLIGGVTQPDDNRAVLWDSVSGKVNVLRHPPDAADDRKVLRQVAFASFSADGRSLVTGSTDRSVWSWDVAEARPVRPLVGHTGRLVFAAFSADGRRLVTAAAVGAVRVWDPASGEMLATLKGIGDGIHGAALSPDGQTLVSAHEDGTAWLSSVAGLPEPKLLSGHRGAVKSASFSNDGRAILTTSADGTARLWDTASASEIAVLRGHGRAVDGGLFSPDGMQVFTRAGDGVRSWSVAPASSSASIGTGHDGEIKSVAFSGDDRRLVTAGWDNTARLTGTASTAVPTVFRHAVFNVESAALALDGQRLLTVAGDGRARVWNVATPDTVSVLVDPDGPVSVATFSADGRHVVTAGAGGVRQWPLADLKSARIIRLQDHGVVSNYERALALSADGRLLIAHFSNNRDAEWDLSTGKITWLFPEINIHRAAYSSDGTRIVALDPSQDGIAQVWDKRSDKPLAVLRHPDTVAGVAFSTDGTTLATLTNDGVLRLWDVVSQRLLETVGRHPDARAVAFSHDGRSLASAGYDVRSWPLLPRRQALIDIGCARVPWPLSQLQRERFGVSEEWCTKGVPQETSASAGR